MKITIHSVIDEIEGGITVGDPEINIITLDADVRENGETLYVRYREESEAGTIQTVLTASPDGIRLSKKGATEWDVIFVSGESSDTVYRIPPYAFDAHISVQRAEKTKTADGYVIRLIYLMNIGGADKSVKMKMTLK